MVLLCVTVMLFPLLYLTLELPKQIINGAIDADLPEITVYGYVFTQIEYLMLLCGCFLAAVLCHGLLKMRINTMRGVLAERLLRRFRYTLIARILRFPQPYFERTSQGELVSMVTAESEPMGGLMGDALAQPVLQAGQMLTILFFLFAQSITFGLAACALIPLQAWLIPKLQRQINLLNKRRVIQVRALAAEIGEGAAGASTLRINHGWRYRLAMISDRLGRLYAIRFEIYQKKFFMKFLNNFINQLTPFFFYAIGGYLVIVGEVSLGALVAALAAFKDLSGPWKELLAYYNQSQDMSLRWETITERFAPSGMVDEAQMEGEPEELPHLTGDIVLHNVAVQDADGNPVLQEIDLTLPGGSLVGVKATSDEERRALSELITRELVPSAGRIEIGGTTLNALHQGVVAARIGHATSRPVLFQGSFGENVLMPVKTRPLDDGPDAMFLQEAIRAGNSGDSPAANWIDPARGGAASPDELIDHWCDLVEKIGGADALFRRALDQVLDADGHPEIAGKIVAIRPRIATALAEKKLTRHVFGFDPASYNPALPVVQNLLYATPHTPLTADALVERQDYLALLRSLKLDDDLMELALAILEGLRQIFGAGGTDHPLFQKTGLDPALYESALAVALRQTENKALSDTDQALLMSVPSSVTAELLGPAFPERIRQRILAMRAEHSEALRASMGDLFAPIPEDGPVVGLTVLENALYGKLSSEAGPQGEQIRKTVSDILRAEGAWRAVLQLVFDVPITLGGANLPAAFTEPLAVSRAVIKRPDVVILDNAMAGFDPKARVRMIEELRRDLPEATLIYLSADPEEDIPFDMEVALEQGRLTGSTSTRTDADGGDDVAADLARKVALLEQADLFAGLDRKQLRLLGFGARWYKAPAGTYVFHKNDPPDSGAYVMIEGEADLLLPQDDGEDKLIVTVSSGALVGELGLIRNEPRALDMRAKTDITCLRLGVEEFLAVVENDAATAFKILQVVAGYVKT